MRDMVFHKASHGEELSETATTCRLSRARHDPRATDDRQLDEAQRDILLAAVTQSVPNSGFRQFWELRPQSTSTPPDSLKTVWEKVIFQHVDAGKVDLSLLHEPSDEECEEFVASMILTADEVATIEASTRKQAKDKLWVALHNGRLTSSKFAEVLCRQESTDPKRLVSSIMDYKPQHGSSPAMKWGVDNESRARLMYINEQKKHHQCVSVRETGLSLHPDMAFLGASSDGYVSLGDGDNCSSGCIEIKCPFSISGESVIHLTPAQIASKYGSKFYLQKSADGSLVLNRDHAYFVQVQGKPVCNCFMFDCVINIHL